MNFIGTAVVFVNLVHHNDGFEVELNRLGEHEARLGHGAFKRVNEQQNAIGHFQYTFNLSTEVAVAGSVNDVDLDILVGNGDVFRKNGNPTLTFEVVVVKHKVG